MRWYCYCCGEKLGAMIALVSGKDETDRVFLMMPDHVERIADDTYTVVLVARTDDHQHTGGCGCFLK